jgi:DNA-binding transcriptional MerR regulator
MGNERNIVRFIKSEHARKIGGVSRAMLDYLDREEFIRPSGPYIRKRGQRRLYTYSDLVTLRVVRALLAGGIEITRLKAGLTKLKSDLNQLKPSELPLHLLVTDGHEIYLPRGENILLSLNKRQFTFSFVINVRDMKNSIEQAIRDLGGWRSIAVDERGRTKSKARKRSQSI